MCDCVRTHMNAHRQPGAEKEKKKRTHDRFNRSCCQRPAHRTTGVPSFVCSHRAANSLLPGQSEEQCKPDVFRFGVVSQHRSAFFFFFFFCAQCKARLSADVAFGKHLTLRVEVTSAEVSVDVSDFLHGGCYNKGTEMGTIDDGASFGKILFWLILKIVTHSTVV